jgi:dethiobiotin synthetase
MSARIIFVTGVDTEAGKTVLAALSLCHLQAVGKRVRAVKPFCSGGWQDTDLLRQLHRPALSRQEVTPWFFEKPAAPLIAARQENRLVELDDVLQTIREYSTDLELLLVEGAGGLLAPLGIDFNAVDLIRELNAEILIAGRNKLGIINHALLTIAYLKSHRLSHWRLVLMGENQDPSSATNREALAECLKEDSVLLHHLPEFDRFDETNARILAEANRLILVPLFC